jgi:type IV pilus assembly protein PilM
MQEDFFGLDIGSNSLKAVELAKREGKYNLLTFGYHPVTSGAIFSESEIDQKQISKSIRDLVQESHISSRNVVTAFPESLIFTRVIEVPMVAEKEFANAIEWQAEQYIPMPLSEVRLSWMILNKEALADSRKNVEGKKPNIKVLLVAAPNSLINRYLNIIRNAGLVPVAFETEIVAITRSLTVLQDGTSPSTLLLSVGSSTTDLAVVDNGIIRFTRSIGTGGTALARAISQDLGFDMNQAEEYKKAYGLLEDQLEGKIMQVIKPVFDVIVSEVERAIMYYQTQNPSASVKRMVLTGGSAQLPGLVIFLANSLGLEVQIGNPWVNVVTPDQFRIKTDQLENQVVYAVAAGLAMRNENE